jgi:hypothetical protein
MSATPFPDLPALARHLREELRNKNFILLYGYNGTGKTRLSTAFKDLGKNGNERDTLYFNAYTEDLFSWDNDLKNDRERVLTINKESRFFAGLDQMEMDNRIRPLLDRYADFDFKIDTNEWEVSFSRDVTSGEGHEPRTAQVDDIKISRGEENIFIWCFFLAILQLVLDGAEAYSWVKYVYVDDPISSLDEHNAIVVANHLAQLLVKAQNPPRTVVSSHHTLFFNVLGNEFGKKARRFFLSKAAGEGCLLRDTGNTPFFHHVASLCELSEVAKAGGLRTHHFNVLRSIMEKTASFHGYDNFADCIRPAENDPGKTMYTRVVNIMSHGNYSLYEPIEMMAENEEIFKSVLDDFRKNFPFNPKLFGETQTERIQND